MNLETLMRGGDEDVTMAGKLIEDLEGALTEAQEARHASANYLESMKNREGGLVAQAAGLGSNETQRKAELAKLLDADMIYQDSKRFHRDQAAVADRAELRATITQKRLTLTMANIALRTAVIGALGRAS